MIGFVLMLMAVIGVAMRLLATPFFTAIWVVANLSYAGMRAQDNADQVQRKVAFCLGFPGTVVSLILVTRGSGRVYGVDLSTQEDQQN